MNTNHTGRIILVIMISLVLLAGAFSGGVILGWLIPSGSPLETLAPDTTKPAETPPLPDSTPPSSTPADLRKLFQPFWEAWDIIHEQYVDQPVDDLQLMRGAIQGMLNSLGDIHTGYMTPEDYDQATTTLDGSYGGIGAWVDTAGEYLTIIRPMSGSPAEAAGLKPGDEIIGVDGQSVIGKDPSAVLQTVKGPEGTTVVLTVQRHAPEEILDFTIVRAQITVSSVESRMLDQGIGYLALNTFGSESAQEMETALAGLLAQHPVGLILDLRDNNGGYVDAAIDIISQFIGSGVIMIERFGDGKEVTFEAHPGGLATEIPLVVLVNQYSASASEITAGAIQDYQRGKIVGTTTYGKGSVQNWVPLADEQGAVKVTIARWLTPKGRLIHGIGLTPDYIVERTENDIEAELDPQLEKAIDLLLNANK